MHKRLISKKNSNRRGFPVAIHSFRRGNKLRFPFVPRYLLFKSRISICSLTWPLSGVREPNDGMALQSRDGATRKSLKCSVRVAVAAWDTFATAAKSAERDLV